jgi:hypothetical protein
MARIQRQIVAPTKGDSWLTKREPGARMGSMSETMPD